MSDLSLTISLSAVAGGAMAVFGNLQGTLTRIATATRDLRRRQAELGRQMQQSSQLPAPELARLTAQYERQRLQLERLRASTQRLGRTQAAISANEANRQAMRGKLMESAGLAYLAAQPLKVGIEFESSMSRVQALTRLSKDSEEMKQLTAQARALGAATSFTASEAAQAQGFLAMAGFDTQKILAAMPSMLNLAKAGDVDLQRTADIASNILSAFKLDAAEMTRVADVMTKTMTTSNVNMEQLAETMKYMAPVAQAAGMSLEEASAMAGLLGNIGIQGSNAGTALRATLTRLAAGSPALQRLGIDAKDAAGNLRSVPAILADVYKATGKMGSADRMAVIKELFGQYAVAGGAELVSLTEGDQLARYIDIVKDSRDAANQTATIMGDNMRGSLLAMKSAWEDLSISLTQGVNTPLRELVDAITQSLRSISKWVGENPAFVGGVLKLIAALLSFRIGLLAVSYAASLAAMPFLHLIKIVRMARAILLLRQIGGLALAFPQLSAAVAMLVRVGRGAAGMLATLLGRALVGASVAVQALKTGLISAWPLLKAFGTGLLQALIGPLKLVQMALVGAGKAVLWFARSILFTPIGAAIAALAVAGWLLTRHWEPIAEFFSECWDRIKAAFSGGLKSIGKLLLDWSPLGIIYKLIAWALSYFDVWLPTNLSQLAGRLWSGITGIGGKLWSGLVALAGQLWSGVKRALDGGLAGILAALVNWSPFGVLYRIFATALSQLGASLPASLADVGRMLIDGLIGGLEAGYEKVMSAVTTLGERIVAKMKGILGIASPSTVFAEIGRFAMWGFERGFSEVAGEALLRAGNFVQRLVAAFSPIQRAPQLAAAGVSARAAPASAAAAKMPVNRFVARNLSARRPLAAPALPAAPRPIAAGSAPKRRAAAGAPMVAPGPVTIHVHPAPGMDEKKLADLVAKEIAKTQQTRAAHVRSRLVDAD